MRPLYFIFKIIISYSIFLFFKKKKIVNAPRSFYAQTIFVVNHSSAFLDPWVIAQQQNPILFFLTRGDIFKKWLLPFTWATHLIPIFRTREDGADSSKKNEGTFKEVNRLLKKKKSILIFGEGYTDDVFIRSLKSLKKGPARIGFGAMESSNWEDDIKIQCSGINYADPNEFRSEVLIANSEVIHLKDYKDQYIENPSKAINDLTKEITDLLRAQLTYLEDAKLTDFHNQIQAITKQGIAHENNNKQVTLEKRWRYSQKLATYINQNYSEENTGWQNLKTNLSNYFNQIKTENIKDNWILNFGENKSSNLILRWLIISISAPIFLLGAFHFAIPYKLTKNFIEKTFKRRVFWSGIKMMMGYLTLALFNIILCFVLNSIFNITENYIIWLYIIFITPFIGLFSYWYLTYFKDTISLSKISDQTYKKCLKTRENCVELIKNQITL